MIIKQKELSVAIGSVLLIIKQKHLFLKTLYFLGHTISTVIKNKRLTRKLKNSASIKSRFMFEPDNLVGLPHFSYAYIAYLEAELMRWYELIKLMAYMTYFDLENWLIYILRWLEEEALRFLIRYSYLFFGLWFFKLILEKVRQTQVIRELRDKLMNMLKGDVREIDPILHAYLKFTFFNHVLAYLAKKPATIAFYKAFIEGPSKPGTILLFKYLMKSYRTNQHLILGYALCSFLGRNLVRLAEFLIRILIKSTKKQDQL